MWLDLKILAFKLVDFPMAKRLSSQKKILRLSIGVMSNS